MSMKPIFRKEKVFLLKAEDQAKVQEKLFANADKNISQMEEIEHLAFKRQMEQGTVRLKREAVLCVKKEEGIDHLRTKVFIMIEFNCQQLVDIGGIRFTRYLQDREDVQQSENTDMTQSSENADKRQRQAVFFYTSDLPDQSLCWIP